MKYIFRFIFIFLLIALVFISLYNRKQYQEIAISEAVKTIEVIPVKTLEMELSTPIKTIRSAGRVQSVDKVIIISRVNGGVEALLVSLGSSVKKGQVLARIDDSYLKEQLEIAEKAYDQDLKDLGRLKSLKEVGATTDQQIEQFEVKVAASKTKADLAKKRREESIIKASVSGVINQLFVSEGNQVGQGSPICQIVGENALILKTGFDVEDAEYIRKGDEVRLLDVDLIYPFKGTITSIGTSKGGRGNVSAEISMEENDVLNHDKIVDIEMDIRLPEGLYVPKEGILREDTSNYVFVSTNQIAEKKWILLDKVVDDLVKIKKGLVSGDQLILEGNHLIEAGDSIKEVTQNPVF